MSEGEVYDVVGDGYEGAGEPAYTYYRDENCLDACGGKPEAAGVYYVRAEMPETDYDTAVKSNVAKITIHGKELVPGITSEPGIDPGDANPGETKPGNASGPNPGGTDPGNTPGSTPGGTSSSTKPSASPDGNGQGVQDHKTVKKTVTKLKRKKSYYVRVWGYCVYRGQKIYGKCSKARRVKVK